MDVRPGRRRLRRAPAAVIIAAVLASSGTAYALWPATGAGGSYAAARQLPVPGVTATCTAADAIRVDWTSETAPVVASFLVTRSTDGGATWATVSTTAAVAGTTAYSVNDSGLAEATYRYRVTAQKSAWSGTGGLSNSSTVLAAITIGPRPNRRDASCA